MLTIEPIGIDKGWEPSYEMIPPSPIPFCITVLSSLQSVICMSIEELSTMEQLTMTLDPAWPYIEESEGGLTS